MATYEDYMQFVPKNHCHYEPCENEPKFQIGTNCVCRDCMNVCYMHLQKGVTDMSERDDSHMGKKMVTVIPVEVREQYDIEKRDFYKAVRTIS